MVNNPEAFFMLILLVPIFFVQLRLYRTGIRHLSFFIGREAKLQYEIFLFKWSFTTLTFLCIVVMMTLALADITWGIHSMNEERRDIDVVALVDVSVSMMADDIEPTRLARAHDILQGLREEFPNGRFSLVLFKGMALKAMPFTTDSLIFSTWLANLHPNVMTSQGSNIEAGIEAALTLFSNEQARHHAIVLFSDGESREGAPINGATRAVQLGVPIYVIASGTERGSMIYFPKGELVRNANGDPVITRLNSELLQEIAETTGGAYIHVSDANSFRKLVGAMQSKQKLQEEFGARLVSTRRYRFFVSIVLVLFLIQIMIYKIRWRGEMI